MESLRDIGYDLSAAVADLVDNSLDADAENVKVDLGHDLEGGWIRIADDGVGHDRAEPRGGDALRVITCLQSVRSRSFRPGDEDGFVVSGEATHSGHEVDSARSDPNHDGGTSTGSRAPIRGSSSD